MPDYLTSLVLMLAGFVLLVGGGELLVRGASRLAAALGVSPLVIGLTVVALGTSAPEMAVTLQSSLQGQADLAVGNVVGSNICNVLLILGLSALAAPLVVSSRLIWWDVPLMIVASLLLFGFGIDGRIDRWDGGVLFAGLVGYVAWAIVQSRKESREVRQEYSEHFQAEPGPGWKTIGLQIAYIGIGLVLLTVGSNWLVTGAVSIARLLGVSELLIGLTILAVGTSLPELAASIVASVRGERDIAVGNVVGSNLFNILGVMGLSAVVAPHGIPVSEVALHYDIPVMIAVAVACLPVFFGGHQITRWEGGLFFGYYVVYTVHLILRATQANHSQAYGWLVLGFLVPLTVVTLTVSVLRTVRMSASRKRDDRPGSSP